MSQESLTLKNPHSVALALKNRPKDVLRISTTSNPGEGWEPVIELAKKLKVPVQSGGGGRPDPGRGPTRGGGGPSKEGRAQGAEASVRAREGISIEELFEGASGAQSGLWLALDCLQDPHNVGAIFRAAAFFGVKGIVLTQERSAPLTSTVYDVACGGVESVPFCLITNLQRGFEKAKDAGLWILGTSEHAQDSIQSVAKDRPWLLVLGNEEKGLRRLTEESCDVLCKIAAKGDVTSLNVSVAAGIFISHLA